MRHDQGQDDVQVIHTACQLAGNHAIQPDDVCSAQSTPLPSTLSWPTTSPMVSRWSVGGSNH